MLDTNAVQKKDYFLLTAKIANPDVTRLIKSSEIQAVIRRPPPVDPAQEPAHQQAGPLPSQPEREDPPQAGAA